MPKEEWGTKRVCPTTGKRFYDLNRDPIVSPYTGEVVNLDTGKRSMITADAEDGQNRKPKEKETEEEVDILDDDDVEVDLEDDDVLEDESDDNVSLDEITDVPGDEDES